MFRTAILIVLVACGNPSGDLPPPPPIPRAPPVDAGIAPAPKADWSPISTTFLVDVPGQKYKRGETRIIAFGPGLEVTAVNLPDGTIVKVGDATYTVSKGDPRHRFTAAYGPKLGDLAWASLKKDIVPIADLDVPISVQLPNTAPAVTKLPRIGLGNAFQPIFAAMATSGEGFAGDPPAAKIPAAAAWTINGFLPLGTADRVRDVRFIVVGEQVPNKSTARCTGYAGARDFTAGAHDVVARIVDRTTKAVVATKTFTASASCPRTVVSGPGTPPAYSAGPDGNAMSSWVTAQLPALVRTASK